MTNSIHALKFSPDGEFVLAGDKNGSLTFLNVDPAAYADAICDELSNNFKVFKDEQVEMNKVLKRRFRADFNFDHLSINDYSRYFEDVVQDDRGQTMIKVCEN